MHTATFLDKESHILSLVRLNRHTYRLLIDYLYEFDVHKYGSHGAVGAVISGQLPAVERFIAHDFDVYIDCWQLEDYRTNGNLIWHACRFNALMEVILRLIEAGVDPNDNVRPCQWERRFCSGDQPLHFAIFNRNIPLVHLLLSHGADIHQTINYGIWTAWPLHFASFSGPVELVQLLLELGADPMARDSRERTPLHWAVGIPDYLWLVKSAKEYEWSRSKDVGYQSHVEWDVIEKMPGIPAAEPQEREKIIKLLLNRGADPKAQDRQSLAPLVAPYFKVDPTTGKTEYMLQDTDEMM